jgi:hypothetical protein
VAVGNDASPDRVIVRGASSTFTSKHIARGDFADNLCEAIDLGSLESVVGAQPSVAPMPAERDARTCVVESRDGKNALYFMVGAAGLWESLASRPGWSLIPYARPLQVASYEEIGPERATRRAFVAYDGHRTVRVHAGFAGESLLDDVSVAVVVPVLGDALQRLALGQSN